MNRYYLFTWPDYESGGIVQDCLGRFSTLGDAMTQDKLSGNGCIIEVHEGGLWIVAEYSGYPPKWYFEVRKLYNEQ